jgi:DNA-binding FadR family transcriptional regulator
MPFESIGSRRLYRQIANQIVALIEAGEYKPGERLPAERILAERLAVSRPSVRDALLALEVENRVEIRGGSGAIVLDPPTPTPILATIPEEIEALELPELLFVRSLIEPDMAALAASNATPKHIAALAKALGEMVCCSIDDTRRYDHDREFHFTLAEASGNNALRLTLRSLWNSSEQPVAQAEHEFFNSEQAWRCAIIEHREIVEAVKQGDAKAARLSMQRHVKNARLRFASARRESVQPEATADALSLSRKNDGRADTPTGVIDLGSWPQHSARSA